MSNQQKTNFENPNKNASKGKITPRKEKEINSTYAKPILSSKFKSIKKTVNRLAKYRPTQEVPGFKKSNGGKAYSLPIDPALLQSFQVLSKAPLSNAEAIYQEAKQDLLMK